MDFHDAEAPAALREWLGGPADGVLSDMAANATGHRKTDQLRIVGLVELAADFASEVLAPRRLLPRQGAARRRRVRPPRPPQARFRRRAPPEAESEPRGQRRALSAGDGIQGDEGGLKLNGFGPVSVRNGHTGPAQRGPTMAGIGWRRNGRFEACEAGDLPPMPRPPGARDGGACCPPRACRQCETRFPIHTRAHGRWPRRVRRATDCGWRAASASA